MTARSMPRWSITANVSPTYSRSPYAAVSLGRSDRPLPRGSIVTTRKWRARKGTCAFHTRLCTITSTGVNRMVMSPSPKDS